MELFIFYCFIGSRQRRYESFSRPEKSK
jgi:hypothetical protein